MHHIKNFDEAPHEIADQEPDARTEIVLKSHRYALMAFLGVRRWDLISVTTFDSITFEQLAWSGEVDVGEDAFVVFLDRHDPINPKAFGQFFRINGFLSFIDGCRLWCRPGKTHGVIFGGRDVKPLRRASQKYGPVDDDQDLLGGFVHGTEVYRELVLKTNQRLPKHSRFA